MRRHLPIQQVLTAFLFVAFAAIAPQCCQAASGTLAQPNSGFYSWDDTTNNVWVGNVPANGAGFVANFNNLDIIGDIFVNLDTTNHTIGSLVFGDTDPVNTPAGWTIGGSFT